MSRRAISCLCRFFVDLTPNLFPPQQGRGHVIIITYRLVWAIVAILVVTRALLCTATCIRESGRSPAAKGKEKQPSDEAISVKAQRCFYHRLLQVLCWSRHFGLEALRDKKNRPNTNNMSFCMDSHSKYTHGILCYFTYWLIDLF